MVTAKRPARGDRRSSRQFWPLVLGEQDIGDDAVAEDDEQHGADEFGEEGAHGGWLGSRKANKTQTAASIQKIGGGAVFFGVALWRRKLGALRVVLVTLSPSPAMPEPKHTNALAHEKSPYLLQHAHNPVNWMPWGEAAFEKARNENKPIFLSVGYSTCHWCHVMEHESFENEETAKVLNEHFVSVKVDREERPDVDLTYMTYVQASSGHGGWPMSVFLTPELKPFFGGTYFPPEDKYGRIGLQVAPRRDREGLGEGRGRHPREKRRGDAEAPGAPQRRAEAYMRRRSMRC